MEQRTIARIIQNPPQPGFLGTGHLAVPVLAGQAFSQTDPFIFLMDDQLDLPGGDPVGGAHPHAGFETVTLVLQGNGRDWQTGSLEVMTAGKGIIHTEEISSRTQMRILQLWLVLPPEKRWAEPFWQELKLENVPTARNNDSEIRVYSGSSQGLTSPLQNQTPFTLVDFQLKQDATVMQEIPASYTGFVYVLEGAVAVGGTVVRQGQTAWLNSLRSEGNTEITFGAESAQTRFILYAGAPQKAPIVSHGPFIGDSQEDIARLYKEYRTGWMPHLNDLPESSKVRHRLPDRELQNVAPGTFV